MVGEPFYSKKDALNMWDYETFYCWYLQIAFMDSKEKKKKSFAERLRALPMFVLP